MFTVSDQPRFTWEQITDQSCWLGLNWQIFNFLFCLCKWFQATTDSFGNKLQTRAVIPTPLRIGFLGLGIMGQGMVMNLLRSGHEVTVWNRTVAKVSFQVSFACVVSLGGQVCWSITHLVFLCYVWFRDGWQREWLVFWWFHLLPVQWLQFLWYCNFHTVRCPEVTLCGWQDVKIQLLTNPLLLSSLSACILFF